MRVAVIGIGGTGSAACRWLARAGHEVIGFEQFRIGHARGSSHGASRIIRYTYPDPLYTELMRQAYPLWRELEHDAQEKLLVACGGLFFGTLGNPTMRQAEDALASAGVAFERLPAAEVMSRFPALRMQPDEVALYQEDMGFLRPEACVLANIRLARALGAVIHEETGVREIVPELSGAVIVTENGETYWLDKVIVTAGPWTGNLLAFLGLPLRVTKQHVVYLAPEAQSEALFDIGRCPVWIDADTLFYGFPRTAPGGDVKIALHVPGKQMDPDAGSRTPDAASVAQTASYAASRLTGLTGSVAAVETCLYTNTPDEDFILDAPAAMPHVFVASGCSGHGFKFTVLLGKIAADAVTHDAAPPAAARFSLRRFLSRQHE